ncbi:LysM peptidoglycan-binding domain-containing protein [Bdellovibrio sp. HCB209]|uniref:LysM peptidoglycan-binding domain-containing protein n=1 Tax=Bdellovibrio sp. HCB209 TaxID=3394354 RepID=UPI0039B6A47B
MKAIARFTFTLIFAMTSAASAAPAISVRKYVVQRGDTLSHIADRIRGGHTYGENENLEKILDLNPDVVKAQHIYVGQEIFIPADAELRMPSSEESVAEKAIPAEPAKVVTEPPAKPVAPAPKAEVAAPAPTPTTEKSIATPPPPTKPQQVVVEEEEVNQRVKVSALYQFTTLEAVDKTTTGKASLYTNHDVVVSIAAEQDWTEEFKTHLEFAFRHLEFMSSTSATKRIANETQTLSKVSLGGQVALSKNTNLYFDAIYGQQLFVHGLSSTEVFADTVGVPEARVGLDLALFRKGSTSLGVLIDGSYLGSSSTDSYDIESGYAYGGAFYVKRNKGSRSLALQVGLRYRKQDTSFIQLDEQNIYGSFIYGFDIFGGDK